MIAAPAQRSRMVRLGTGITLAGFVAGGAFAAVAASGSTTPPSRAATAARDAELNTLLSASAAAGTSPAPARPGALRRLRGAGGYYGSITFSGGTLSFERGTIQSVTRSDVVVRAPDGTTMTWQLVTDTVVRDRGHGKASTSALSAGQPVFVGGRVAGGARDARLIVIRTGQPAEPSASRPAGSGAAVS